MRFSMDNKKMITFSLIFIILFTSVSIINESDGKKITRVNNVVIVDILGNGDYTSISSAIDNSTKGDIIRIYSGLYFEQLYINKELNIIGNGTDTIIHSNIEPIIKICTNNTVISSIYINDTDNAIYITESNNISLKKININYGEIGISIDSSRKIKIQNCNITDIYRGIIIKNSNNCILIKNTLQYYQTGFNIQEKYSIYCENVENLIIDNNKLFGVNDPDHPISGIFSINVNIIKIINNTIQNYINGIYLYNQVINLDVSIKNTTIYNCDTCMYLYNIKYSIVNECKFEKCQYGIYYDNIYDSTIINNIVENASYIGLYVEECERIAITKTTIRESDNSGLVIINSDTNTINNCTFIANIIGVNIINSNKHNIINNRIENNNDGIILNSVVNTKIWKNKFYYNNNQAFDDGSNNWYYSYPTGGNIWSDYQGYDVKKGSQQDEYGSDGFGDNPYYITGSNSKDIYPIFLDEDPPVADPGDDIVVNNGDTVSFDGTGSTDDQMVMRWVWEFVYDGQEKIIELDKFDFRFDIPGVYNVTLTVYDFAGNSDSTIIKVTVVDVDSPVAVSQGDLIIDQGDTALFDGSGSTDNWIIDSYQWSFHYDNVEQILYGVNPSFTFVIPGVYEVTLSVRDSEMNKGETTFNVTVMDTEDPIAVAGSDKFVNNGETVTFDATGSSDNGLIESYEWTFDYDGEMKTLTGDISSFNFFIPGTYVINLTLTDSDGNIGTDTLVVIVKDTIDPEPKVTGSLEVMPGSSFDLSAETSTDNHMVSKYIWTFWDPDQQEIEGSTFSHKFSRSGRHAIDLRVWDPAGNSANITFQVNVLDTMQPEANAGSDQKIAVNTKVVLDASGSTDDGEIIKYEWKITDDSGFRIDLEGISQEYIFENVGTYNVLLSVIDSAENIGSDTCIIEVVDTGTLSGVVLDDSGNPVSGATITVVDSNGKEHTTTSASDGSFSIDVPAGSVTWEISAGGYKKASGSTTVSLLDTTEIENSKTTLSESEGGSPIIIIILIVVIIIVILIVIGLILFFVVRSKSKGEEEPGDDEIKICEEPTQDLIPGENDMI